MAELLARIEVIGEAKNTFTPDKQNLTLTVSTRRDKVKDAKREHAEQQDLLLKILNRLEIPQKEFKTARRVDNEYQFWDAKQQKNVKDGYIVTQTTVVKTDIDKAEALLEEITELKKDITCSLGRTEFSGLDKLEEETLLEAIKDARTKAENRTKVLGARLELPLFCSKNLWSEQNFAQPEVYLASAMCDSVGSGRSAAPRAKISVGEEEINKQIRVIFALIN